MYRKTIAGLTLATGLFVGSQAEAYTLLFPRRVWFSTPVAIDVFTPRADPTIGDADNGITAMIDAMNDPNGGWDAAGSGDLVFGYGSAYRPQLGDYFPTIVMDEPFNICSGGCLAATLTNFYVNQVGDEQIIDADMLFNDQINFNSQQEVGCSFNEYSIEGVLQHEIGHVLGLGHSNSASATMYYAAAPCDFGAAQLAQDDFNGVNDLY